MLLALAQQLRRLRAPEPDEVPPPESAG
jgi:hypothetical protein